MNKVELQNIQGGVIIDLFNEELKRVIANIEDENTVANQERSINIKIAIKPDKARRTADVKVQASSTLAKVKPAESFLFFDRGDDGKFEAYVDNPTPELPGIVGENVKQFPKASGEE